MVVFFCGVVLFVVFVFVWYSVVDWYGLFLLVDMGSGGCFGMWFSFVWSEFVRGAVDGGVSGIFAGVGGGFFLVCSVFVGVGFFVGVFWGVLLFLGVIFGLWGVLFRLFWLVFGLFYGGGGFFFYCFDFVFFFSVGS